MGNSCQSRGTGLVSQPLWQLSVFHCRAANALRHARIAVIKRILKQKQNVRQSKLASGCHSLAPRAATRQTHKCISSVTPPPHTSTLKEWIVFYFHLSFSKHFTCLMIYEEIKLRTHKKVSSFQNKNVLFVFQNVGTLFGLKCAPQPAAEIARWCDVLVVARRVQYVTHGISAMPP